MNIKLVLMGLATSLLTISCNHVYKKYDKESFPIYTWKEGQEIIFNPKIEDVSKSYTLTLALRHLYGFQLNSLAVKIKSISPSGKETTIDYAFKIKDSKNEYLAKCAGDYCDLETVVDNELKFEEAGEYKYVITHNVPVNSIAGVMEVGLIIDEKR